MPKTKDNKNNLSLIVPQFERLKEIHLEIAQERFPNTQSLAKKCEVSVSTISRDMDFLRDRLNAPIEYNALRRGYFYTETFDFPFESKMDAKQLALLSAAKTLISYYQGTPLHDEIKSLLDSVTALSYQNDAQIIKRIALPPSPHIQISADTWEKITSALEQNFVIAFDYKGKWNTEITARRVRPYQLLLDKGLCFLWGFAEERDDCRLFNLARMQNVRITSKKFTLPNDFEFSTKCGGGRFGAFVSEEKEQFEIKFYDDARDDVKACLWADDQEITEDNDSTTITFSASQYEPIMEWVLSQGAKARPLAPAHFVDDWKERIQAMAESAGIK